MKKNLIYIAAALAVLALLLLLLGPIKLLIVLGILIWFSPVWGMLAILAICLVCCMGAGDDSVMTTDAERMAAQEARLKAHGKEVTYYRPSRRPLVRH